MKFARHMARLYGIGMVATPDRRNFLEKATCIELQIPPPPRHASIYGIHVSQQHHLDKTTMRFELYNSMGLLPQIPLPEESVPEIEEDDVRRHR